MITYDGRKIFSARGSIKINYRNVGRSALVRVYVFACGNLLKLCLSTAESRIIARLRLVIFLQAKFTSYVFLKLLLL